MATPTAEQSIRRIAHWGDDLTAGGISGQIARQLLSGDWLTPEWLEQLGARRALLAQVVAMFDLAGYEVERMQLEPSSAGGRMAYRLTQQNHNMAASLQPKLEPQVVEQPASQPNPALGAELQVRALALSDDGVQLQLSDGNGSAWLCLITGYLAPVKVSYAT
jgi:hypothetical protein